MSEDAEQTPASSSRAVSQAIARFRRSGADLPFGDPCGDHGSALEGYFWRITLPSSRSVVIVMASINRDATGGQWGTVALAAHPGGLVRATVADTAHGATRGIGLRITHAGRSVLEASGERLLVDLGPDLRLDVRFTDPISWQRRSLGGVGVAHLIPGLSQYWHPHMLSGRTSGSGTLDGRDVALDGGTVYAEKNWGPRGFPSDWWWGQAQAFDRSDVCAAFAGGVVGLGPLQLRASALVVRIGSKVISAAYPLQRVRTRVDEEGWSIAAQTARHTIRIDGRANGVRPHSLPVPVPDQHRNRPGAASQHLAAEMRLMVSQGRRTVYHGESTLAGLERGGSP